MMIRWRRILLVAVPAVLMAIAFAAYAYSRPTTRCVIFNEAQQTTVQSSGKRCTELLPGEEAIVLTPGGASVVSGDGEWAGDRASEPASLWPYLH